VKALTFVREQYALEDAFTNSEPIKYCYKFKLVAVGDSGIFFLSSLNNFLPHVSSSPPRAKKPTNQLWYPNLCPLFGAIQTLSHAVLWYRSMVWISL